MGKKKNKKTQEGGDEPQVPTKQTQQQNPSSQTEAKPSEKQKVDKSESQQKIQKSQEQSPQEDPKAGPSHQQSQQTRQHQEKGARPKQKEQPTQQTSQKESRASEQKQHQQADKPKQQEKQPKQHQQADKPKQQEKQPKQQGAWSSEPKQQQRRDTGPIQELQWQQSQQTSHKEGWASERKQHQQADIPKQQEKQPKQQGAWSSEPKQQQQDIKSKQQWQQSQEKKETPQYQQQGTRPKQTQQSSIPQSQSKIIPSISKIARGTAGRRSTVETNYLLLNLDKMPNTAYHYDVSFKPDRPKKFFHQAFDAYNEIYFSNILMAFDGNKSFYTVKKLDCKNHSGDVEINDTNGRTLSFNITIQATGNIEIDLNSLRTYSKDRTYEKPMRALQCLEIVLANACRKNGIRAGRSYYIAPTRESYDLEDGYEMWIGLYQAMILGDLPLLNIDVSHKSFPKSCTLTNYLKEHLGMQNLNQPIDRRNADRMHSFLSGVTITYNPPSVFGERKKNYKYQNISNESADNLFFLKDNKKITVAEHFKSRNYNLQYPKLNCINVGSSVKSVYLPMELCTIPPGQALNKKDKPKQVQKMIRYSATSTNERKFKIMELLQRFQHNANLLIQGFGIQIDTKFLVVNMRILNPPRIEYLNNTKVDCLKGAWNPREGKFIKTAVRPNGFSWAIIYSQRDSRSVSYNKLEQFASMLHKGAEQRNLNLAARPEIKAFQQIEQTLRELKKVGYDFVIVVIPEYYTSYADIKQAAELKCGILTQCIKSSTFRRLDFRLIDNILLKLNNKLNGTNHIIASTSHLPLKNVMFLGADVTHPSPDQRHIPSVVGVASSHDINGASYNMQYRLQKSTIECIEDMESIFKDVVSVYFKYQRSYPQHIIYFRDGVSDGQFPIIDKHEIGGIRAACNRLRIQPKITCIIVIKRHHTRFFPQGQPDPRDKFNNVLPGTVVDETIVHPNEVQYFLTSHQAIQGTAKPARYNVICDDAKMNIDDLQKLSFNMCHLFPRCNRSVSYPAPAYLAHLAAYRGRVYLENSNRFGNLKDEYAKRLISKEILDKNPMFFV